MTITLGTYLDRGTHGRDGRGDNAGLRVLCDAPELRRHVDQPWFRAHLAEQLGLPLDAVAVQPGPNAGHSDTSAHSSRKTAATVTHDLLGRHTCLVGATGSGKTRLALHLLAEQIQAGCSVVLLDPKAETLLHLLALAKKAGIAPQQVTLLAPQPQESWQSSGGEASGSLLGGLIGVVPGWNPLDPRASGIAPAQAAADFVSVLSQSTASWGPRLQDILTNALIVIGTHGLSLFELARFLQRDDYRDNLLATAPATLPFSGRVAYGEAHAFFTDEFGAWSRTERASAVAPVMNKVRELLRSAFLRSLLCARRNTLDLASLWQHQRLVLVHLDRTSLGDEGARLLGGLLTHHLYRTALRVEGPVPVVLSLDEMGVSEQFVGKAAGEILAVARSRNLRLLVACQHLAQLSDELRTALLANTAVRVFFRLGHADAKVVASSLAAGVGERVTTVSADVAKRDTKTGLPYLTSASHVLLNASGEALRVSVAAWHELRRLALFSGTVDSGQSGAGAMNAFTAALPPALVPAPKALTGTAPQAALASAGGSLALRSANGVTTRESATGPPPDPLTGLQRLCHLSGFAGRLYVRAPDTNEPVEVSRYLAALSPGEWRLGGPAPLTLSIFFPKPRLRIVGQQTESERQQAWTRTLMDLPVQQAVLATADQGQRYGQGRGQEPAVIRVVDVRSLDALAEAAAVSLERYLSAAAVAGGQSLREIESTHRWREEQVESVAASGIGATRTAMNAAMNAAATGVTASTNGTGSSKIVGEKAVAGAAKPAKQNGSGQPGRTATGVVGSGGRADVRSETRRATPPSTSVKSPELPAVPTVPTVVLAVRPAVGKVDEDGSLA